MSKKMKTDKKVLLNGDGDQEANVYMVGFSEMH